MSKQLLFGFVLLALCLMDRSDAARSRDMNKTLAKNSKRLYDWVNSTNVTHTTTIYLFDVRDNITDPNHQFPEFDDYNPQDPDPVTVAQVGPFKFRQERQIKVVGFEDFVESPTDQDLLVVSIRKFYHYVDEGANLDQNITVLNTPLQLSSQSHRIFILHQKVLNWRFPFSLAHIPCDKQVPGYQASALQSVEQHGEQANSQPAAIVCESNGS